jgi:hypothetical protein
MENFYSIQGSQIYMGSGNLGHKLNAGLYSMKYNARQGEAFIEQIPSSKSDKTKLTAQMSEITAIVSSFAKNVQQDSFSKQGWKSKFGLLLEGPPGTGKSQIVSVCTDSFVEAGGIVVFIGDNAVLHSGIAGQYIKKINRIQPSTPILFVLEDVDGIPPQLEVHLTSILDGEQSPSNTFFLGTTNFLENITPRILRPGRFDLIYKVNALDDATRKSYIDDKIASFKLKLNKAKRQEMYDLTKGYTFAEIRTYMAYVGFFGFEAKNLAAKIARLDAQDPSNQEEPEREDWSSPEDFSAGGDAD